MRRVTHDETDPKLGPNKNSFATGSSGTLPFGGGAARGAGGNKRSRME